MNNEIIIQITQEVKDVLKQGRIEESSYFLPSLKLERYEYVAVNKILELLGGKWNRSKKAHIFESAEKANEIFNSLSKGSVVDKKKTFQFFETPKEVVSKMIKLAGFKNGMRVLEPSAGHGAILKELPTDIELHIIEIDKEKCDVLESKGYKPTCIDFLEYKTGIGAFERIIMNPPFTRGQDAEHILYAYKCLSENGTLVSVCSASIEYNSQKKYEKVRQLIEKNGKIIKLENNSFKESGTNINTVLVVINK